MAWRGQRKEGRGEGIGEGELRYPIFTGRPWRQPTMRFNILLLLCVVGEFSELRVGRTREGVGCGKGWSKSDGSPGTGSFPFSMIMFYTLPRAWC